MAKHIKRPKSGLLVPWSMTAKHRRVCFAKEIVDPLGFQGTMKKLRKSSASDVELHHPGLGGFHLGHRAGRDIARLHYLDPRIIAENRPMPDTAQVGLAKSGQNGRPCPR